MLANRRWHCHFIAMNPLAFSLLCFAGLLNLNYQGVIEYLQKKFVFSKNYWARETMVQ